MKGWLELVSERSVEAEADYAAALELYAELGNATREAGMTMMVGRAAFAQGELDRAENAPARLRTRAQGPGDRGSLCEAQRALAMVLVEQGALDEAERFALEARETVGPEDRISVSSTKLGLAVVRAAQNRDAEAEELMLRGGRGVRSSTSCERSSTGRSATSRSSCARADATTKQLVYETRRAALSPSSTAPIV